MNEPDKRMLRMAIRKLKKDIIRLDDIRCDASQRMSMYKDDIRALDRILEESTC